MCSATISDPSPLGPATPSFELTSLRVRSRFIDVSLEITHGILNVWFGANGSGKSLMLRAVRAVLRGDYSEFGDDNDLYFDATFAIPQNVEVWTKIEDHVSRDYLSEDEDELQEEEDALTRQVDKLIDGLEDSIFNPSSGVARPRIRLIAGTDDAEYWTLEFGRDYEDGSAAIELDDNFRAGLRDIFPEPVFIDNNLINALPIWLPTVVAWSLGFFPSPFSIDRAQGHPVDASVFFATTPRNSENARTEVEWSVRVGARFQEIIERLIELSQHFLPAFVSESWIVTYQFSPPTFGNEPIQIKLRSRTGDSTDMIDLANASEGIKRWVTISLAIASIVLWGTAAKEFEQQFREYSDDPKSIRVSHYYFLIDEPEAHLSPNAISSVASPITNLAPMTTLIATHSPILIDGLREGATFRGIRGTMRTREVHSFPFAAFVDLRNFEKEMGLRASELLLRSGRLLLVEGDHDAIVLKHRFPQLDAHGIYVAKTSGTYHLDAFLKCSLIKTVSKRVAVLLDKSNYRPPRYLEGVEIRVFKLEQPDILYYIPAAAVRVISPRFSTWEDTWDEYQSNDTWRQYQSQRESDRPTSHGWKKYIDDKYDLNLSFDFHRSNRETWAKDLNMILETTPIESLILSPEEMKLRDELTQKVDDILNWVEELTP
jgi:energy-coupling factor transporter ATP-binding protein EcfA2